jgi:ABC-type sugar transport system ATPase subunit
MPQADASVTTGRDGSRPVVIEARRVSKRFPGVQALTDVDFELRQGEVHGLVGQNGAGKSTLMKVVSGVHTPDAGQVLVDGEELRHGSPRASREAGIAVIYQELTIAPEMSAADNVFLSGADRPAGWRSRSRLRRRFDELGELLGIDLDPSERAGSLSVARQQQLEIMRALDGRRRVILMDEPTAALGRHEREALYRIIGTLRESGIGIVYISHDLDEVLELCDRVSVMRDGLLVETRPREEATKDELVKAMVGSALATRPPPAAEGGRGREVLRVEGLNVPGAVHDVSFSLHQGEILGLAGLVGAGRTEILRAVAGADPRATGLMRIDGQEVAWPRSVRAALRRGIALAPEDRKSQGLVLNRTAAENVVMSDMRGVARGGLISGRRRRAAAAAACGPLAFDTARLDVQVSTLSGGNQQKLALAKWVHRRPRILLVDEPTRGIDVGAKVEVLRVLRHLADDGLGVILVSSELEEVVEAADRALVVAGGRGAGVLEGADLSVDRILQRVFAVEEAA